ncbi:LamB/YcsF family protein, partial [Streptomyces sp. SID5910]|uniref:LamB/YcsF family protein n=1 Tax=Streptomyces sp. SID5910 TaxID=2690312 RepID=UPI0013ABD694
LGLPGSRLLAAAGDAGLTGVPEAFADRAYTPEGTLVPRREADSVVTEEDAVVRRALAFAVDGAVEAVDGTTVAVAARSLCVHGDTPGAARIAARVREALAAAGVRVGAFA